jgi:two-component system response regulator LytT
MTIKTIIIEDELPSAKKLQVLLQQIVPNIQPLTILESVSEAVSYLQSQQPDLIILDIHLADGNAFQIFEQVAVKSAIIFTTAYNQYALQAFKQNSIDYLLKPIKKSELQQSIEKYQALQQTTKPINYHEILSHLLSPTPPVYQQRLLVNRGNKMLPLKINDIAYFYADSKLVFCTTFEQRTYLVNHTLDKTVPLLNPQQFSRINRKCIVNIQTVVSMQTKAKGRLLLELNPKPDFDIWVPTEKASTFKQWLSQ